jgi:hypothetical protein
MTGVAELRAPPRKKPGRKRRVEIAVEESDESAGERNPSVSTEVAGPSEPMLRRSGRQRTQSSRGFTGGDMQEVARFFDEIDDGDDDGEYMDLDES